MEVYRDKSGNHSGAIWSGFSVHGRAAARTECRRLMPGAWYLVGRLKAADGVAK
jgi:hypothetical protein